MWWRDAVVYQIYPRSFQDSDGDGVGDLRGIAQRLDHLAWLGVDAFWLSPIYPSPLADFGYDVSDYTAVDPQLGSLEDFDELIEAARERGLRVLLDLILCHTSIEHPWFREHPDWYIWSPVEGPPNNGAAPFGGPAWSRDERSGRWYMHSFYPEQPDLDWRNPEVVEAMQGVVRFWRGRGADGFRLDAIDRLVKDEQLRDDPPATKPFPLPLREDAAKLEAKLRRAEFTLEDFLEQLQQVKKMGPIGQLVSMIPGMGSMANEAQAAVDRGDLKRTEAIVRSMTIRERREPSVLNGSRRRRIAAGSGTSLTEVNRLVKQFTEMQRMMKQLSGARGRAGLNALVGRR